MSVFKKKKIALAAPHGHFRDVCRNFARNRVALAALIVLTVIVLLAAFADVIADYNGMALKQNPRERLQLPARSTGSARTTTGATCLRASFTARAIRFFSASAALR